MFVFQEKYDERFQSLDFRNEELVERYEDCEFISCNFQDSDLSKIEFISCEFKSCNFSLASFLGSKLIFVILMTVNYYQSIFPQLAP